MDLINSLLLLVLVIVPIILFVTQPLTRRRRLKVEGSQALSTLLAERDRVLNALKELDFDHSLGKIPVEEYPQQRANLVQHGAQVLRQIDQLAPVAMEDEAESLVARRRKTRQGGSGLTCSHCGRPLLNSDRFCPGCGQPVRKKG